MITFKILGQPGRDNAAYVVADTGQATTRFLFDCGYGCLDPLAVADIMSLEAAFFSHFHMDHVSGFDALFRCNYDRGERPPLRLIGPEDTRRVLQHRMQAYTWNLVDHATGSVIVSEFGIGRLCTSTFRTRDQFRMAASEDSCAFGGVVLATPELTVTAIDLDHGCVSAGYVVREADRMNVDTRQLAGMGLRPGSWLKHLKGEKRSNAGETMEIDGSVYRVAELQEKLLRSTRGASLAYLTDFRPVANQYQALIDFIQGVDVLICENNYANADLALAKQNYHLCSQEVGEIAASAHVGKLILFHLADRYTPDEWRQQMEEVRETFSPTEWPEEWKEMLE
jgi:ribonuclease Z